MGLIDFLKKLLGCKETISLPIIEAPVMGTIKAVDAYRLFLPLTETGASGTQNIFLSDGNYSLTSIHEAMKFVAETGVEYGKWTTEDHDCDNFSFALMGYWSEGLKSFAFGIAWSSTHAFNIMIDEQKQVWIIEPQSATYMTLEQAKQNPLYYPLRLIML